MKRETRLVRRENEELAETQFRAAQGQGVEFASPEEAIRRDRAELTVPPGVAERLGASLNREPLPQPRPWWKRLFSSR